MLCRHKHAYAISLAACLRQLGERELVALLEANGYTVQSAFEQIEPARELNGVKMQMSSLVMTASVS